MKFNKRFLNTCFLYKKNFYKEMSVKDLQNLKKLLRKSPASNAWAAIFKNSDFS